MSSLIIALDSRTEHAIKALGQYHWHGIGSQGGQLKSMGRNGLYNVPGLVIYNDSPIMLEARSVLVSDKVEVFVLGADIYIPESHTTQERLRWRPPISEVMDVPADLELSSFIGATLNFSIIRNSYNLDVEEVTEVFVDEGILVSNNVGRQLLIKQDWDFPESLMITTNKEFIATEINKGQVLPIS